MAPHHISWIASSSIHNQQSPQNFTQGATCQPLEDAIPQQYYLDQSPRYQPGASLAPSSTMQSTQSTPALTFDSSPDRPYSDTDSFELDHDILNNLSYLEAFNFIDYNDFDLFSTNESSIRSGFTSVGLFPDLGVFEGPETAPYTRAHKFSCQFGACTESFPRQCELTRHELKHTRPFKCTHCAHDFAEKRRCIQHVQSVHGLATDNDKTKCHLCRYAHVRPDAVKRHLRLKHGVGLKPVGSPSTSPEIEAGGRQGRARRR